MRIRRILDRAGLGVMILAGLGVGVAFANSQDVPVDADMVYRMGRALNYGDVWASDINSRYVYPPVLAQLAGLWPFGWEAFVITWEVFLFAAMWVALRWWALPVMGAATATMLLAGLDAPLANPLTLLLVGNIQALIAAAVVVGLRHPAAWTVVLLTKIAPGVGVLWFAVRGEWRHLAIALSVTAVVALLSVIADPALWLDFARFALANAGADSPVAVLPVPLWIRLPVVIAAIVWAARTDRAWMIPIACAFASLALYTWSWITMAAAALPLLRGRWRVRLVPLQPRPVRSWRAPAD